MSDLSGTYEVVLPITAREGAIPAGETVELSHADAEIFLARGFVNKRERSSRKGGNKTQTSEQ